MATKAALNKAKGFTSELIKNMRDFIEVAEKAVGEESGARTAAAKARKLSVELGKDFAKFRKVSVAQFK